VKVKHTEIKFSRDMYRQLYDYLLADHNEKHAFLFGRKVEGGNRLVTLVDKLVLFDTDEIDISPSHVTIDSSLANGVFQKFAQSDYDVLISCHSHPFENGRVWFSGIDDTNDHHLFSYFYQEILPFKKGGEMFTMVFGRHTIAARGYDMRFRKFVPLQRITVMDYPMCYILPTNVENGQRGKGGDKEIYDRQIRAFGEKGQEDLSRLKVALIGVGGTGSIIAEGLVRLGVKHLVLVDADRLEMSNLNRWQGGELRYVGQYKVNITKKRLKRMAKQVRIRAMAKDLFSKEVVDEIKTCDILIGAVDGDKARYVLNRIALTYMIPYVDVASGILLEDGKLQQVSTRNIVVVPSVTECLSCTENYIDKSKLAYELVTPSIRRELIRRKYIKGDDEVNEPAPAVYGLNMLSVSTLLLELMNLVFGYKAPYGNVHINYLNMQQPLSRAWDIEKPSNNCFECQDRLGMGDEERVWEMFA